ncbi:MAG: hypothetical protein Q9212_003971 [Teloschistes hypoglaucus]
MPTTRSNAGTNNENVPQNRGGSAPRRGRPEGRGQIGRQLVGRGRGYGDVSGPGQQAPRAGRVAIIARGRGEGLTQVQGCGRGIGDAQEFSVAAPSVIFAPPSESTSQARARARSNSPTKRDKTFEKDKLDADIGMKELETCYPSVQLRSRDRAIEGGKLPPMVVELDDLVHAEHCGFIPVQLKPAFDRAAAAKGQRAIPAFQYLPDTDTSIPEEFAHSIKATVEMVVETASNNNMIEAHERQWGWTTISPLFSEVLKWPQSKGAMVFNVESCPIDPVNIRMLRPGRQRYVDEAKSKNSELEDSSVTTTRMVDVCLGLNLDPTTMKLIFDKWAIWGDFKRSLNQSTSYIIHHPLFLDVEIKKTNQERNPLVQLGMWMAGLYAKRQHHGWDQSVPMPGLVVNGDQWFFYIGFARGDGVVMLESLGLFGSTATIAGTFEIIYKLNVLVQWGLNQYHRWFNKHIVEWFRREQAGLGHE